MSGSRERLEGLDVARGLAVFGMAVVNFKFVMGLEGSEAGPLGTLAAAFDGRAAAAFVTLAGMGVSLLTRQAREAADAAALSAARRLLLRRAAFLFGLGFLDSFLWPGDILHFYAAYLLAAAALLAAPGWVLPPCAAASILAFAGLFWFLDWSKGWDWEAFTYLGQWRPEGLLRHLLFNGFHPVFPWISFLIGGMWLGRGDLSSKRLRAGLLAGGIAVAVAAEVASPPLMAWAASHGGEEAEWCALFFGTQSMPPAPLYIASGGGSALALIALCLEAADRLPGRALGVVATGGRCALSLYAAHVLFGLAPIGLLGFDEGRSLGLALSLAAGFYAAALLGATLWCGRFQRGPVELLMRRWTG